MNDIWDAIEASKSFSRELAREPEGFAKEASQEVLAFASKISGTQLQQELTRLQSEIKAAQQDLERLKQVGHNCHEDPGNTMIK
jgi:hypothetical protein